jgi:imidazoleglycerol phosphate dehydratase HisB
METTPFKPFRVTRTTGETEFAIDVAPYRTGAALLELPNRMLAHLLDHFVRGAGMGIAVERTEWPRSWEFDHVLCEDLGQLVGRAVAAIAEERTASAGILGRATAESAMDDAASRVSLTLEARPRCHWDIPRRVRLDGYVDSWYGPDGGPAGVCHGTNLRQFLDGFAYGSGATIVIAVRGLTGAEVVNLHHLYETIFRNLGDAVGAALGIANRAPGEGSGLAGTPQYRIVRDG